MRKKKGVFLDKKTEKIYEEETGNAMILISGEKLNTDCSLVASDTTKIKFSPSNTNNKTLILVYVWTQSILSVLCEMYHDFIYESEN